MEEYIGKKCPFCKTKIEEGEAVKVCPACGIPHHESCWNENAGCTTFGCSMQNSVVNSGNTCPNCGAPLATGQSFCTKCGTPVTAPPANVCARCGAEVAPGSSFCTKCGAPQANAGNFAPPVAPPPVQNNAQAPIPPAAPPVPNNAQAPAQAYVPPVAPQPAPAPVPNEAPAPAQAYVPPVAPAPAADTAPEPFTTPAEAPVPEPVDAPPVAPPAEVPFASPADSPAGTPDTIPNTAPVAPQPRVCTNCGAEIQDNQSFCVQCGTPAPPAAPQRRVCSKCGAELQPNQEFCTMCGQKADLQVDANVNSAISQFNSDLKKNKASAKKKPLIIAGISVAAVLTIVLAIIFIPKLFVSTEKYLENGEYEKAYSSAKNGTEKSNVTAENAVAVCSSICIDKMSASSSFDLKNAYYDNEYGWVVLEVGSGSYGDIEYWLFSYTNESGKFSYINHYDNLDKETVSVFDFSTTRTRKIVDNLCKTVIKETEKAVNKLATEGVDRVNALKKAGKLSGVTLISGATYKTKADSSSSSSYDYDDYDYDDDESSYSYY